MTFSLPRGKRLNARVLAAAMGVAALGAAAVATAMLLGVFDGGRVRTAFATAPEGLYLVAARDTGLEDVIVATSVEDPSQEREIARLAHAAGLPSLGSVAPEAAKLALAIPDGGTVETPLASLKLLDLDTGVLTDILEGADASQRPVWARDSSAVFTTRANGAGSLVDVTILRAGVDGSVSQAAVAARVLGAYPLGTDASGALLYVIIDNRGSTLMRDGTEVALLSANITRDWALSPDARQVAFIDVALNGGLHYVPRVAAVPAPGQVAAEARAASPAGGRQALGAAWAPGQFTPTFGLEPAGATRSGVSAQASAGGFDVPLAYAPGNAALAVQAWTGSSFQEPGTMVLQIVSNSGRITLPAGSRFMGWATR